ncbi:SRPBCC family protein [Phytohabitans sp. ZYX-F-186]|uniref:SRPBCC family protein n=1 Tax=Phytohabitans maris TaxID=3071409 RepID=A0ABU0ZMC0_9ACTN|nr:SRPBCC family protein [Phytohabitans sp. ZYX-F-186]MDQ7908189.1 SRPBCC family protein [Phytohabitans sp. ZYX-F-186]
MSPVPTGRLFRTDTGVDLVLTRRFRAPAEDVWASLTEPERTARWFGPWEGQAAPGRSVKVRMVFEEGAPWMEMRIDACEPPRHLALSTVDEAGSWHTELLLSDVDGGTELRFVHHLRGAEGVGEIGPGWEYYLDLLVAARDGTARAEFGAYYPALKGRYEALTAE